MRLHNLAKDIGGYITAQICKSANVFPYVSAHFHVAPIWNSSTMPRTGPLHLLPLPASPTCCPASLSSVSGEEARAGGGHHTVMPYLLVWTLAGNNEYGLT